MNPLTTFFNSHIPGLRKWFNKESLPSRAPLLTATELQELAHYTESIPFSLFEFERHSSAPLLGEIPSPYRGRGFEFDENRLYQPGDEQRLINWRLYARTGELYSRLFTEEHRPQIGLVLDRRANMRFATRKQLKVKLAAKLAACCFFQARSQGLSIGGLFLDQQVSWLAPATGQLAGQGLLEELSSPCPPLPPDSDQPDLLRTLLDMSQRLPRGSFILLLSDFSDLDPDSAAPVLNQLCDIHTIHAIQILDPVELALPAAGDFLIENSGTPSPISIHARDSDQHTQYRHAMNDRQDRLRHCFKQNGIPLRRCTTGDDVEDCLDMNNVE